MPQLPRLAALSCAAALALGAALPARAEPQFLLTFLEGTSAAERAAFHQAADAWSAVLATSVTVELTVGTADLGAGTLGGAASTMVFIHYHDARTALAATATSAADATAVAHLQAGPNLNLLINGTANNPNGSGSFLPYLDNTGANTSTLQMTHANARAMGLGHYPGFQLRPGECLTAECDGYIAFNTTRFDWDLDPADGITPGSFDFVGAAMHEIGHALGFTSGVTALDFSIPKVGDAPGPVTRTDDQFTNVSPLDLFRCSAASAAQAALDWTVGSTTDPKLFSLDGCETSLARFSTGSRWGDGWQAGHWEEGHGFGIMDPTAHPGERMVLTSQDLTAMDVIGWTLAAPVATPAPSSALAFAIGLAGLAAARRRRSQHIVT